MRKSVFGVKDQVRHKMGYTAMEAKTKIWYQGENMYLLICAVNSYLYDISMECKVYMSSSLPQYQYVMQSSVVILGI